MTEFTNVLLCYFEPCFGTVSKVNKQIKRSGNQKQLRTNLCEHAIHVTGQIKLITAYIYIMKILFNIETAINNLHSIIYVK